MQSEPRIRSNRLFLRMTLLLASASSSAAAGNAAGDGKDAFDWEIGTWKTEVRRLAKPLSGSNEWLEYAGTSVVRDVLDGRANLVELRVQGPAGRIEGISLRLFNPQTGQWSLNYAGSNGMLTPPVFGGFRDGRGEFFGQDDVDGRAILVRFVVSEITRDSARFEQAFSVDGGRTWELNWIATDTRIDAGERAAGL